MKARTSSADDRALAQAIAQRLALPCAEGDGAADPRSDPELVLWVGAAGLGLAAAGEAVDRALAIDFDRARQNEPRAASDLLARAAGLDRGARTVIDATAGLGRDALALALRGASVLMIERHPVLAALLEDALARAQRVDSPIAARLELVTGDAGTILEAMAAAETPGPHTILIDPMYPQSGKDALPKRDLQLLRTLIGRTDDDADLLVAIARRVATRRVVVKRPPRGPLLAARPIATFAGSRVRYDVYAPDQPSAT